MMRASPRRGSCTRGASTPRIRITNAASIASEGSPRRRSSPIGLIQMFTKEVNLPLICPMKMMLQLNRTEVKGNLMEVKLLLEKNEARKVNQMAMVAETKRMEAPPESRGISKQKWLDERKKRIGKLLDANGLDMSEAYMLDTQEMAEAKYKKWEKESAPFGWDVFNQKTLYSAYKKRTKNIERGMEAYNKAKEDDLEFYQNATSLQYGKAPKVSEENIDRMVKELQDRDAKRKSFSRRRRFHDEKDIDSINDRNEHFNKKIERAFGKYTLEIKNNLERGTALPD